MQRPWCVTQDESDSADSSAARLNILLDKTTYMTLTAAAAAAFVLSTTSLQHSRWVVAGIAVHSARYSKFTTDH